ncbi:hypothetical protein FB559_2015 [Actinoallomurus bryophytorum]|uniref:Uncharacterized protein n=1 Tax=Actinoallomurus bryophytorum TaxID=1490222 RepID=A0A543CHA5_9ACTN|nr:DUF6069 family protein [Actinoallomurus bryophytorum]TQL96484.1 hypothetical protein FB559_2015 [Actinoallomurus bryophytorum]
MNTSSKRILTVIGAPAAALATWVLAVPLAGITLTARTGTGTQAVGPVAIVVTSLLAGLAAWALVAILERFVARPGRIWMFSAPAVFAASLSGPLGSGVGAAAVLALVLLHLVVASVLLLGLMRRGTRPANI